MTGWSFAFSRRWIGYLALIIVFALVCVSLGFWQIARRGEALAEIDRIETNWNADPVPLADALPQLDSFEDSQKYLPVTMTGVYLTDDQRLARNRPRDQSPGFEVLTPLQLADGTVFIVDRGWLPTGSRQDAPDEIPEAPSGEVTVVARLKAGEPHIAGRSASGNEVATIELNDMAEIVGESTYTGAYGLMDSETPATATRPAAAEKPALDEGPHLSYAFQWFVFALLGFIGFGWAVRNEYRMLNADDPEERERALERERRRAKKAKTDGAIEDEILDAQHTPGR
ncbi:SURF1 family cytochrome oxidase biogenesis protein [Leifsonia sp. Leaf264]|uniref:SURF1 family cytochrome oxidase biogenesis protein n=1 Tax=Leifsonia sp. Leaf264 TaxID=1736314 RepID=UPI0006F9AA52|nr:SURF1 family protein [Leifsonia sp. Leaf264]KQO93811.1 sortase [Leifsonia sp. Leaf264]